MTTSMIPTRVEEPATVHHVPIVPRPVALPEAWDPFQLMDRLDEEALKKELEGIASTELVYVVKEGGQEVVGLSKVGVDECCMVLVSQGQVVREEDLEYELLGAGEDQEALFKVKAARYAVSPSGVEVKLDQVLGVKRQPLYYEPAAPLSLESKVPGKKWRDKTFREALDDKSGDGRGYIEWIRDGSTFDPAVKQFAAAILSGEAPGGEFVPGRRLNPHWFEAGAMKAARNARFRLIPADTKALIIARARQGGQAKVVERSNGHANGHAHAPAAAASTEHQETDATDRLRQEEAQRRHGGHAAQAPSAAATTAQAPATTTNGNGSVYAPTEKQIAFYQRLADSPVFTEDERQRALQWLATKATRQTIKDQIDWLKRQVETRKSSATVGA